MVLSRVLIVGALFLVGAGCTPQAPDERGLEEDTDTRRIHAVVVVERVDSREGSRGNVSAKFMRVSSADLALAERLVGSRPLLPDATECVALANLEQAEAQAQRAAISVERIRPFVAPVHGEVSVDLLDVGDVRLTVMSGAAKAGDDPIDLELAPRAFPDVGDVASGVFYTSPDANQAFPIPADYHVVSTGADAVEGFDLDVVAPRAPSALRIAGKALDDDALGADSVTIRRGFDVPVEWAGGTGEADSVYLDVRGETSFRCAFPDTGSLILPAELLRSVDNDAETHDLTLTVHRLAERRAPVSFHRSGGDASAIDAVVRFDLARVLHLEVR